MKRITSFLVLCAFALCVTAAAYAQSTPSTPAQQASPAQAEQPKAEMPKAETVKTHSMSHKATSKEPPIDLNSASKEDLMKLSGITDETAEKIIAARPFKSKAELLSKKIVTRVQYAKVRSHVIAKQEKMSK